MGRVSDRLRELGITLPQAPAPRYNYVPFVVVRGLVHVSGQVPKVDGELRVRGRMGADVGLEEGREAARICARNALAQLVAAVGDLDAVEQIVRVTGYVASSPEFFDHPRVIDAASELLVAVFGDQGRHTRAAVGVASLPSNATVELDLIAAVAPAGAQSESLDGTRRR